MTEESNEETDEKQSTEEPAEVGEEEAQVEKKKRSRRTQETVRIRKKLLALPMFLKFVIILVIKISTDLIVFPLLLLYRFARLIKRRFLKLIGKDGTSPSPKGADAPGEVP